MIPDFVNRFTAKEGASVSESDDEASGSKETAAKEMEELLKDSVNQEENK